MKWISNILAVLVIALVIDTVTMDMQPKVVAKPQEFHVKSTYREPPRIKEKVSWCRNKKDCKKLAEAVVYEARGESALGQYAVAWVIMNRSTDPNRPKTVSGVVQQHKQFSYLRDMKKQTKPTEKDWTSGYVVAYDVLNKKIESPVENATHYHATKVKPKWAKEMRVVARIDNHVFYR